MKGCRGMKKLGIILALAAAFILPVLLIPLLAFLLNLAVSKAPMVFVPLSLDFGNTITSGDFLALYLGVLGIIATIMLSYLIYRLERNNERRAEYEEIRRAKRTINAVLGNGIKRAFESQLDDEWENFDFIRVTDNHIGMIASIGHLLSEEQFLYLNQIMETLKDIAEHEKNGDLGDATNSVEKLMSLITVPVYPMYRYRMRSLKNIHDALSKEAIEIFNLVDDDCTNRLFSHEIKYDQSGKKIFRSYPDGRYKVYDQSGNRICDALFKGGELSEGFATIFYEQAYLEFEGSFVNGERNGSGVEYFFDGRKSKEGKWQSGELVNGRIYDVQLDMSGEIFGDKIKQIDDPFDFYDLERYSSELQVGDLRVVDSKITVVKESILTAADFLKVKDICITG